MKVSVSPEVIRSLREDLKIPAEVAAKRVDVGLSTYEKWENEKSDISIGKLKTLARLYNRSWAVFLLERPVSPTKKPNDFRTSGDEKDFSTDTIKAFQQARYLLEKISDFDGSRKTSKAFLARFKLTLQSDTSQLVTDLREVLETTLSEQKKLDNSYKVYRYWVDSLFEQGIYTVEFSIPMKEVRAFSLRNDGYTLIVNNSKESIHGKIFSLLHELGHILLGETGVCDLSNDSSNTVEPFCNRFAANLLMPNNEFLEDLGQEQITNRLVASLSNRYHVSELAVYRKLLTLGYISDSQYKEEHERFTKEYKKIRKGFARVENVSARKVINRNSRGLVKEVLEAYQGGKISYWDIAKQLNTSIGNIPGIQKEVG